MPTTSKSGESMFTAAFMGSGAYVASTIPRLVCLEVVEALRPALRHGSSVTVMRIKTIVDMAVKAMRTMKPRTRSKKHSTNKPIGPIVAVRSTVIGGIVEVSVRANGSRPDIYADGDLRGCYGCTAEKGSCENCKRKHVYFEHHSSTIFKSLKLDYLAPS
jgi:hypothetical protein